MPKPVIVTFEDGKEVRYDSVSACAAALFELGYRFQTRKGIPPKRISADRISLKWLGGEASFDYGTQNIVKEEQRVVVRFRFAERV